ncbi:membrane hypothetical protein [Methylocella tundrae]|uniref:Uncharacterized protein n=1 Tax=Methylocella tundrae TaxID=227605 RepID=A0A8B6M2N3_METTU|nr:hypothetical protein [Methylocella tundrae]VTZ24289.1 membrane hypothetical protein [Methylocella tundrae]VTZ49291.1 membrane hypothetical protein [Methylocella tundrae]
MDGKRDHIPDEEFQKWLANERAELNDVFDPLFKGLNYLFVAHGAGLFGAITLVKDGKGSPYNHGITIFFYFFPIGLITAIISYIYFTSARLGLFIRASERYEKTHPNLLMKSNPSTTAYIGLVFCAISAILLISALILISIKARSL